jgi:hypothetical protein
MDAVRRLARQLALPLMLLLPGLGGAWLQLVHPCPERHGAAPRPVAAAGHDDAHAHHEGHHAPAPGDDQDASHERCACVAACGQAGITALPLAAPALQVAERAIEPAVPVVPEWLPVFTPRDFLPLATAPPAA